MMRDHAIEPPSTPVRDLAPADVVQEMARLLYDWDHWPGAWDASYGGGVADAEERREVYRVEARWRLARRPSHA